MGEGAIAVSWQESVRRELDPQAPEHLEGGPLTYEWAFTLAELNRRLKAGIDDTLIRYPKLFQYARIMTDKIRALEAIDENHIANANGSLPELYVLAKEAYYAYGSIHDMGLHRDGLQKISYIFDEYLSRKKALATNRSQTIAYDERLQASILEALGSSPELEPDNGYTVRAMELNKIVVDDETTPLYLPYKLHALFSMHDMRWRHQLSNLFRARRYVNTAGVSALIRSAQLDYYKDLETCGNYMEEVLGKLSPSKPSTLKSRIACMTGTLSEIYALGEVKDYLLEEGLQGVVRIRKSYMSEDATAPIESTDIDGDITVPNLSFDFVVYRDDDFGPLSRMNVEVKKKKRHSDQDYVTSTYMLGLGDSSDPHVFATRLVKYAQAKQVIYKEGNITSSQRRILDSFRERVDPGKMVEAFAKHSYIEGSGALRPNQVIDLRVA